MCEQYSDNKVVVLLENLLEVTKNLVFDERSLVHNQLLSAYIKTKDVDKALELWMKMEEEDVIPPNSFLVKLAHFLKSMNRPVPFVDPTPDVEYNVADSLGPIEKLVIDGKLGEAKQLVMNMLKGKVNVDSPDLVLYFQQISKAGDVETLESFASHISPVSYFY